jgi:hypothetical protein
VLEPPHLPEILVVVCYAPARDPVIQMKNQGPGDCQSKQSEEGECPDLDFNLGLLV